ncbi:hypothetical protein KEM54_001050 [Ascosphaera aggregata]|nr:hypothetical protein KEM54_001050 [Ascosphaera aggregata]
MPDYKEESAKAQQRRDDKINAFWQIPEINDDELPNDLRDYPRTSGLLTEEELTIVNTDAVELVEKIRTKELTSLAVTKAFCKASVVAHKLTNCITEVFFEEGLKRAQELDDYYASTEKTTGPLHGLPVSLKDNFAVAPYPASIGLAKYANQGMPKDSVVVDQLRRLGAIFYVKTNVPTMMLLTETTNNVWGETRNPVHNKLTPGGSSGGEGALLAIHASPLGVGTDIGESIRIPSAYCGIYGLKPTSGRISTLGNQASLPGQDFVYGVVGPMARSLDSLKLFCENVCSAEVGGWAVDPKLVPLPWRKDVIQPKGRKLRFGIVKNNDQTVTCHPPVERALKEVREKIGKAGHEVIDWVPSQHGEMSKILMTSFRDLAGDYCRNCLAEYNEPPPGAFGKDFVPEGKPEEFVGITPAKLRDLIVKRNAIQKEYLDQWMATRTASEGPIDGLIFPVNPYAAQPLDWTKKRNYLGYTAYSIFSVRYLLHLA